MAKTHQRGAHIITLSQGYYVWQPKLPSGNPSLTSCILFADNAALAMPKLDLGDSQAQAYKPCLLYNELVK